MQKLFIVLLFTLNWFTHAYHPIGFMLTLFCTHMVCERSFSTLKFIRRGLRIRMLQDNLEALMLMAMKKELLMNFAPMMRLTRLHIKANSPRYIYLLLYCDCAVLFLYFVEAIVICIMSMQCSFHVQLLYYLCT